MKILLGLLLLGASLSATIVDGTAARVGKTVITIRDARFYLGVHAFKNGRLSSTKEVSSSDLSKGVQKMIFEAMVFAEAKQFQIKGSPKARAKKLIEDAKNKQRSSWRQFLREFNKSEAQAIQRLERSLVVEQFVERKVETLTPVITQAEVERYYRQNAGAFSGKSIMEAKPQIVAALKKDGVEKGLGEWVRFLKKKYQVANLLEG